MGTTARTFYLEPTDQDDTWGTTVLKLDPVQTTTNTTTMTLTFGTSTSSQTRTVIPYAAAGASGNDAANRQWAVNQGTSDGMQSVSGQRRLIAAGVWTARCIIAVPAPGAVSGAISCQPIWTVYRVGAGTTYTRTALFTLNTTAQSVSALGGGQDFTFDMTSSSQPVIILEPGETIGVGITVISQQTAGLAGATVTNTQTFKTGVNTFLSTPSPGIRSLYDRSHTGTATPAATLTRRTSRILTATVTSSSSLTRLLARLLTSAVAVIASVLIRTDKKFVGAMSSPSATLVRVDKKLASSSIALSATVKAAQIKIFTATIATAGALSRRLSRVLTATITSASTVAKTYNKNVRGFLYGPAGDGSGGVIQQVKRIAHMIDD